jgi:hypothetical protein
MGQEEERGEYREELHRGRTPSSRCDHYRQLESNHPDVHIDSSV